MSPKFYTYFTSYCNYKKTEILIVYSCNSIKDSRRNYYYLTTETCAWTVIQSSSAMLGHSSSATGLEYLADFAVKLEIVRQSSSVDSLCVLNKVWRTLLWSMNPEGQSHLNLAEFSSHFLVGPACPLYTAHSQAVEAKAVSCHNEIKLLLSLFDAHHFF